MEDKDKAKFIALWVQVVSRLANDDYHAKEIVGYYRSDDGDGEAEADDEDTRREKGLRAQEIFEGAQALCYIEPERILRLLDVVLED
jgi:hypothetical protein